MAHSYVRHGGVSSHRKRIWKSVAFLGRYANQPLDVCLKFPVSDLSEYSAEVAELLKEEAERLKVPR